MATTATSASPSTQDLDVSHLDLQDGGISSSSSASSSRIQTYPIDIKRKKIRVAIVTENFLPKIDGVTRTLARLLEHLHSEGHEAMVLGPDTGLTQYAGHPVVGTFGVPLIIYPGLKLNFMRPRFIRRLQQFKPDVIHFVDPIWLGAQMLPVVQKWLPEVPCVSSYHTNLPTYATLFGMPWLEATMWRLTRNLHDRCEVVLCPSESTRRMLQGKGFTNVEIWSRGVDMDLFSPSARDENLRSSWGCTPKPASLTGPLATPSMRASELDEAALTNLLGNKLGLVSSTAGRRFSSRSSSSSSDDESFIRTPPTGPMLPSLAMTPELSPPPSYDSLSLPPLPSGGFSLPPPAMSMRKDDNTSSGSSSNSGESKTVILYVGRISWEKNLRLLIEAFRLLPSSVKAAAKLVFVGDGPARGELTRLCAKLGLDASFMGHQKGTRLAAMYASSSVFAFPSFTETFGQVVFEALASGLPVVGLHAEGTSDLVTHGRTGLLLDVVTATKNASLNARENAAAAKENGNSKPNSPALKATTISDFATAATSATKSHSSSSSIRSSPLAMRAVQNGKSAQFSAPTSGLSTPIPSVGAFASSMSPSSPAFAACSRRYSMLLERLIRDRTLRATMGQRALESARSKTWYEAMEKAVDGYEVAIKKRGAKNLTDDELEEIRGQMRGKEILTGPATKIAVFLYLALFLYFWHLLLH